MVITPIAHIETDFKEKFGIPRQSGCVPSLLGRIVFLPAFRNPEALRGLEGFSHLWLLFDFSKAHREGWSPTVRPPRLGGNKRVGVFASRSPFRPNPIGLSCVRLLGVEETEAGHVLLVSGADLLSGTPILDIKPYLPFADCVPDAVGGYADEVRDYALSVDFPPHLLEKIAPDKRQALLDCLAQDPRPSYQEDPERVYRMQFADMDIHFVVEGDKLKVVDVIE
ncbi:MAG: tRNA (N6-threonylcarbamoyladenosine(37)-N6)-methyltransferase TrmO [Ruminococcaceae bacterium]|nr:tRNA (N6-threonylcarbamoyladenosine(37)-N6)-methyltransferase TrmO [Oscillospiraceae bacterium]